MNDDQYSTLLRAIIRMETKLNRRQRDIELNQRLMIERVAIIDESLKILLSLEANEDE